MNRLDRIFRRPDALRNAQVEGGGKYTYEQALALAKRGRGGRHKIGNNRYLVMEHDGDVALTLRGHAIVRWLPNGQVALDSCGYQTAATKAAMNEALPYGWHIVQTKGKWFVWDHEHVNKFPFTDGMVVGPWPGDSDVKAPAAGNPPRSRAVDDVFVGELIQFIEQNWVDEYDQYNQLRPISDNLFRKWEKGIYDHDKAVKLWRYFVDNAARAYASGAVYDHPRDAMHKWSSYSLNQPGVGSTMDRHMVALKLAGRWQTYMERGEIPAPKSGGDVPIAEPEQTNPRRNSGLPHPIPGRDVVQMGGYALSGYDFAGYDDTARPLVRAKGWGKFPVHKSGPKSWDNVPPPRELNPYQKRSKLNPSASRDEVAEVMATAQDSMVQLGFDKFIRGQIVKPGKFEGEPWWILYYYDAMMNGDGAIVDYEDGGDTFESAETRFEVEPAERTAFGLKPTTKAVILSQDGNGFAHVEETDK